MKNKERQAHQLRFSEGSYSHPIRSTKIRKIMLIRKVHIRYWTVLFLFFYDAQNSEDIEEALFWAGAPDSIVDQVQINVNANRLDEGFCYSEPSVRRSVVAVGKTTTGPEMLNTIVHEIVHIAQHIAIEDGIDPYSEDMAYLCGDIASTVSDIVCTLSCPHCNK